MKRNKFGLNIIETLLNKILFWRSSYEPFYWFGGYYKKHDFEVFTILKSETNYYFFFCRKLLFKIKK